ncbi:SH3 and multiple ankyrin repeat domains protein 3, partial [Fasciola gigantica]
VLLDLGQSPNTRDQFELTPLYYAVLNDTVALCVERLLFDHSVLGKSDEAGLQEIHQACRFGRVQHLETLLAYGADINSQTAKNGNTPLHICAFTGQESCARLLLFRGADRTLLNRAGHTAHQQAVLVENTVVADLIRTFQAKDVVPLRVNPKRNERRRSVQRIRPQQRCASLGRLPDYEKVSDSRPTNNEYEDRDNTNGSDHSNVADYGDYRMTSSISGYCLDTMLLEDDHCDGQNGKSMFDSSNRYPDRVVSRQNGEHLSPLPPPPTPLQPSPIRSQLNQLSSAQQNQKPEGISLSRSTCNLRSGSNKQYGTNQTSVFDGDYAATMRVPKTNSFKVHASEPNRSRTGRLSAGQMSRPSLDPNWMIVSNSQLQHHLQQPENGSDTASIFSTNSSIRGIHASSSFTSATSQLQMLLSGQGSILDLDTSNLPRVVVLQKGPRGFGFVVRGRRGVPGEFQPTLEVPGLQYLEKVEAGSAADRAGLKSGDFILEVNGTNVSTMSHEAVVQLIRNSGETLGLKVITVPVTLHSSMSSMTSLDQTQSVGTIRLSNGHSRQRPSNELDCASVYSTSTNGTVRSEIFGQQNRISAATDSVNSLVRSNGANLSEGRSSRPLFNLKTSTPSTSSAQLKSSVIPPPPPQKSPGFSRASLTSPLSTPSMSPSPTQPISPQQLSPVVPPKPPTLKSPPPPPPLMPSVSSSCGTSTLSPTGLEKQSSPSIKLNQASGENQILTTFFTKCKHHSFFYVPSNAT